MYIVGFCALFLLGALAWIALMVVGWLGWQYVKARWLTVIDKKGEVQWRRF